VVGLNAGVKSTLGLAQVIGAAVPLPATSWGDTVFSPTVIIAVELHPLVAVITAV
jgi:hypothetical protein